MYILTESYSIDLVVFWHLAVCFISSWPVRTTRLKWFRGLLKNTTWRMSAATISASARCSTVEKVNIFSSGTLMSSECSYNPLQTGSTLRPPFLEQNFPQVFLLVSDQIQDTSKATNDEHYLKSWLCTELQSCQSSRIRPWSKLSITLTLIGRTHSSVFFCTKKKNQPWRCLCKMCKLLKLTPILNLTASVPSLTLPLINYNAKTLGFLWMGITQLELNSCTYYIFIAFINAIVLSN